MECGLSSNNPFRGKLKEERILWFTDEACKIKDVKEVVKIS